MNEDIRIQFMNIEKRFWSKVMKLGPDDCWEWQASRSSDGRGKFSYNRKTIGAHRVAFALSTGLPIPIGMAVCHECDNPICCNPAHLFLGTQKDNVQDAWRKGRGKIPLLVGDKSPRSKLTTTQVLEIKERLSMGVSQRKIAARFNVHQTLVGLIGRGKRWSHVHAK